MALFRKIIFWLHLVVGIAVGTEIAMLAGTGLLMAFEHPLVRWAETYDGHADRPDAAPLTIEGLFTRAAALQPDAMPTGMVVLPDENAPVAVQFGRDQQLFLNGYSGEKVGTGATTLRVFFQTVLQLHRWLALPGNYRDWGRTVTGVASLGFAVLIVSGLWLWVPRKIRWRSIKPVLLLNFRLTGKPRDWNWHNVLGVWTLLPLLVIASTGVLISFPWASNLVMRAAGEPPSTQRSRDGGEGPRRGDRGADRNGENRRNGPNGGGPGGAARALNVDGLNAMWNVALAEADPKWTSVTIRLGGGRRGEGGGQGDNVRSDVNPDSNRSEGSRADSARAEGSRAEGGRNAVSFIVATGDANLPYNRVTYNFNRLTGEMTGQQSFADQTLARRLRSLYVPIHRGEVLGLTGMAIAALACCAALGLVYTGLALSWRRLVRPLWARRPRSITAATSAAAIVTPSRPNTADFSADAAPAGR